MLTQRPGTDIHLLNAMAQVIIEEGLHDAAFIRTRTRGFEAFRDGLKKFTPEAVTGVTGVPAELIRAAARAYARAEAAMIFWGMGITQHVHGVHNARCLVNLALITGRLLEHWHTGALSRRSRILDTLEPEPMVYLSEGDMTRLGIRLGDTVRLISRRGSIEAKSRVDPGLPEGAVFMPFCYVEAAANL